jgi:broad specificity phosphatase PhoE
VIHGQTDAHAQKKICGAGWDLPLNEEGLDQARKLSKVFLRDKMGIKVIFSSPLLRCIQTTDVLHDRLKVKVRVLSGLAERHFGQWEKMDESSVPQFSQDCDPIPGGESLNRFRARVREAIDYILDTAAPANGCALVVTHGVFGRTLLSALSIPDQSLERCALYRFSRESPTSVWKIEPAI